MPSDSQPGRTVDFVARGRGYSMFLSPDSAVLSLPRESKGRAAAIDVRMRLLGAQPESEAAVEDRLPGTTNFLVGRDRTRWRTGVPSFGRVRYSAVYPGIDVEYHGDRGELEYDFVVAPGADAGIIELEFDGVERLAVEPGGDLVMTTGTGEVRQRRPVIFQEVGSRRRAVPGGYTLSGDNRVSFHLGSYDRALPLVIDPVVTFSTYLGGSQDEEAEDVAVDAAGNAWITGVTPSATFPTTPGAFQEIGDDAARGDAFVTKLHPDGSLDYSTYLGGEGIDHALGVDVGSDGSAYVTGLTTSTAFPVTIDAQDGGCGTDGACDFDEGRGIRRPDAFVVKLEPSGSALSYATYLGGAGSEGADHDGNLVRAAGIAVGPGGSVHVTGVTTSADFPVTAGAPDPICGTGESCNSGGGRPSPDAFVASLDPGRPPGSQLVFATYLGGSGEDAGASLAVDPSGAAYVTGWTQSGDFPMSAGFDRPAQPVMAGFKDAFVAKLDTAVSGLVYATYLGGRGLEAGASIAVDDAGAAHVTGNTDSDDFPTSPATVQAAHAGGPDAFVVKLDPAGTAVTYGTYLGGSGLDVGNGIALWENPASGATHIVVAGDTESTDFPLEAPVQTRHGGSGQFGRDAFVAELAPAGDALVHSTYLGGAGGESASGVDVDGAGNAYMAGRSASADFPIIDAVQEKPAGGLNQLDAVVTKLSRSSASVPAITGLQPQSGPAGVETSVVISGTGLAGATGVRFGGVPATTMRVEAGKITALAPAQPEGVVLDVQVTSAEGTSARSPFARFSYAEGAWQATGNPVKTRLNHTATLLPDGRVLVAGGCPGPFAGFPACGAARSSAEVFDPANQTWASTGLMTVPRYGHTATLLPSGEILVAGGTDGARPITDSELYDPVTGRWRPTVTPAGTVTRMGTQRMFHTATLLGDGTVLVVGGELRGQPFSTAERYDPRTGEWRSDVAALATTHVGHTATLLGNGQVLVIGGDQDAHCLACPSPPEVYDPATDTWSQADQPRRFGHTATLLTGPHCQARCGQVLVAGGLTDTNFFRATGSASLFGPSVGWRATANLAFPRATHSASLLPNGKVLVTGGTAGRSAEVYDPGHEFGRWTSAGFAIAHRTGEKFTSHTATVLEGGACGVNCGRVLMVGGPDQPNAELYTPRPSVTSVTPGSGPAAGGTSVVLTGTGFANRARSVTFGGRPAAAFTVESPTRITAVSPPGLPGAVEVAVATEGGVSPPATFELLPGPPPVTTSPPAVAAGGYRLVASDGGVFAFGSAAFLGSTGALKLNQPVVGMATTPTGRGYWLVARDGGVFAFGDARFHGSTGAVRLNQPVVGMASTATGNGYWLVAADGGVFAFGDARFHGSTGGIRLNQPVVAMVSSPSDGGYRLVGSDGGVFAFGDARFVGSLGAIRLNRPMVGIASTPTGDGYWMVAADGGVFAFGDARFMGSTGAIRLNQPMVGMASTPNGNGYWMVAADGGVFAFGGAPFTGSTGGIRLNRPIVGMTDAKSPAGTP